jgi:hypothetical protein
MYLKRAITVNWGNLPAEELEFGPVNLFSGGNGSGKTTAADALQTLMTAAYDNLFTYNPGQDETTQRGRGGKQVRTLASYILGCDDGAFARPHGSDGYIAAVFHPTKGETADPFTAVIGVRAHLDSAGSSRQARQSELLLMIVAGEMLSFSDFVDEEADGRHAVALTDLPNRLQRVFGKAVVEIYDKKGAYLARLYGALRGKRDAVSQREAKNAARTFARFMAYKPVVSIDQFVAEEVLEPHELGDTIRRIRDMLRTVHGMEQEAGQLRDSVARLAHGRRLADSYLEDWLERTTLTYGAAAQQHQLNQRDYVASREEQKGLLERRRALEEEEALTRSRLERAHKELVSLDARMEGISVLRTQKELKQQRDDLTKRLSEGVRPLLEQDQQRETNRTALRNIQDLFNRHSLELLFPELASCGWRDASKELLNLDDAGLPDLNQMLARDWIDLAPLENSLDRVRAEQRLHNQLASQLHGEQSEDGALSQRLARLVVEREREVKSLEKQRLDIDRRISNLEADRVNYPGGVQEAVAAIHQQCPDANPRILCDHVDVQDPDWQMAIEGYIGGARFGILVEADYEAEAIRVVRGLAGKRRNNARVIQGDQARRDADRQQALPEDSILQVLRFTHRTAEHYLRASYGNVVRVADAETLRHTRRGVTMDGMGSGNYALFRCDLGDGQLVFGEAARERNLVAQRQALLQVQERYQRANDDYQAARQLALQVSLVKPLQWATVVSELLETHHKLRDVEQNLADLDLSDHQALKEQQEKAQRQFRELNHKQTQLGEQKGGLEEKSQACDRRLTELADRTDQLLDARDQAEAYLQDSARHWPGLDLHERIEAIDRRLQQAHDAIDFTAEQKALDPRLNRYAADLHNTLYEYNQHAQPADQLLADSAAELHSADFFGHVRGLHQQIDNLHNRLANNVLLKKQEELARLRESFNNTFMSDLCHEVHQAINDGRRTLENLNQELKDHRFGADRERFEFDWGWQPEFKEYWDFLCEVAEIPNLGDGASLFDTSLSEKAAEVRDKLLDLLLDGDEQQALRQLERISDYRHYRRYDILKHPENKAPIRLSEYGTGSGGQLETPAYIIRAAAVTSAFRFNEGDSHLRMVIVDEAFMHMDEARSRQVLRYLTETLGLQLIFIMPTSKIGPFLDLVSNQFVFSKLPATGPIGELNTRVLVDRQHLNQERISELWEQHRRVIRQQGALDFMEDV